MLAAINSWIESRNGRACLLATVAAVYLLAYLGHDALPGNNPAQPLGWAGWWDQSQYIKCAADLAAGHLSRQTYWYPIGYPLLGALFYRLAPHHAFFLPNLACVLGIAATFYQIAKKVVSPFEAVLLSAALLLFYHEVASNSLVVPWNTIPTHLLSYAIILLVGFGGANNKRILAAVFCVGLIYLCRPPDALCLAFLPALAVLRLPNSKERFRIGSFAFVILFLFYGADLLLKHAVFGTWATPYEKVAAEVGFGSFPILPKLYLLFIDGAPVFHQTDAALLPRFPWWLLVFPGTICFARRLGVWSLGFLLSIAMTFGIYCAYNDFWPANIFKYHLIHYLLWTLPLLALLAYLAIKEAWKFRSGRWGLAFSLLALLVWAVVTLTAHPYPANPSSAREIPGSPARPVDWIVFQGAPTAPRLEQRGNALHHFSDFIIARKTDGVAILLGNKARQETTVVSADDASSISSVVFGRLSWRLKWPRPFATNARAKPQVELLGTATGIDLAGPAGMPDGAADQVIEITEKPEILQQVASWEIEAPESRSHWTSAPNAQGWWLIKVLPLSAKDSQRYHTVRLCLPDFGQLEQAPASILRAQDADGRVLLSTRIPRK